MMHGARIAAEKVTHGVDCRRRVSGRQRGQPAPGVPSALLAAAGPATAARRAGEEGRPPAALRERPGGCPGPARAAGGLAPAACSRAPAGRGQRSPPKGAGGRCSPPLSGPGRRGGRAGLPAGVPPSLPAPSRKRRLPRPLGRTCRPRLPRPRRGRAASPGGGSPREPGTRPRPSQRGFLRSLVPAGCRGPGAAHPRGRARPAGSAAGAAPAAAGQRRLLLPRQRGWRRASPGTPRVGR